MDIKKINVPKLWAQEDENKLSKQETAIRNQVASYDSNSM